MRRLRNYVLRLQPWEAGRVPSHRLPVLAAVTNDTKILYRLVTHLINPNADASQLISLTTHSLPPSMQYCLQLRARVSKASHEQLLQSACCSPISRWVRPVTHSSSASPSSSERFSSALLVLPARATATRDCSSQSIRLTRKA